MRVKLLMVGGLVGSCLLSPLLCKLVSCCIFHVKGRAGAMGLTREEWAMLNTYGANAIRLGGSSSSG